MKMYFPYCPAMTASRYSPVRSNSSQEVVEKVLPLLERHQILVVSGTDRKNLEYNSRIGKTRSFLDKSCGWEDLLRKKGLTSHYYNRHPMEPISDIPNVNIYLFDEIHYFFHWSSSIIGKSESIRFWDKISFFIKDGKKIIFITALHPQNPDYNFMALSRQNDLLLEQEQSWPPKAEEAVLLFFCAPVIELPAKM